MSAMRTSATSRGIERRALDGEEVGADVGTRHPSLAVDEGVERRNCPVDVERGCGPSRSTAGKSQLGSSRVSSSNASPIVEAKPSHTIPAAFISSPPPIENLVPVSALRMGASPWTRAPCTSERELRSFLTRLHRPTAASEEPSPRPRRWQTVQGNGADRNRVSALRRSSSDRRLASDNDIPRTTRPRASCVSEKMMSSSLMGR